MRLRLIPARDRRKQAMPEVERYFTLAPDMVILAGFDGYWKRVNPTVEAVLGYTEVEALSRPFMEFVHPDDRERTESEARRVAGGTTAFSFVNRILCKDGSYKWIEWTATPVPDEGVMWGIGRDVSERRRSESEQAALRRVATLAAEGAQPDELFAVVAEEIARVVEVPLARIVRYEPDGTATEAGSFAAPGVVMPWGRRSLLEGGSALRRVRETAAPARLEDYSQEAGEIAELAQRAGLRSGVGCPIIVAGRLWGAVGASSRERFPEGTEHRLAAFTDLLASAIANAESRTSLERLAEEQAALQRVATLVAQGVPSAELFSAVSKEAARVFSAVEPSLLATVIRFDPGPESVLVAASRPYEREPVGSRWAPKELYVSTHVLRTEDSARVDEADLEAIGGPDADVLRLRGFLYQVGSPVVVEGRLWGAMTLNSEKPLPPDTEQRLERFTELVATAIANAESREARAVLTEEQAALRRVATLVARDAPSGEVFESVAAEVGRLFDTDITIVGRYDEDGMATAIGNWSAAPGGVPVGTRSAIGGRNLLTMVAETGKPARVDGYDDASGEAAEIARRYGWRSSIAAPIVVEDRLWGVMLVATQRPELFPAGAEERLAAFTDLISTAVANAEGKSELAASRRRIVAASDEARRRIERDLHDGVQQQLVSLGFELDAMKADPRSGDALEEQLASVTERVGSVLDALVEIARGIHPAILSQGGLGAALNSLARRSAVPVELDACIDVKVPDEVEVAAYYVVAEALTNVAKYARASVVRVDVAMDDGTLTLVVRDDGIGGADPGKGSGLVGLRDRVEALGGTIKIDSSAGRGTCVVVTLPIATEPDQEIENFLGPPQELESSTGPA